MRECLIDRVRSDEDFEGAFTTSRGDGFVEEGFPLASDGGEARFEVVEGFAIATGGSEGRSVVFGGELFRFFESLAGVIEDRFFFKALFPGFFDLTGSGDVFAGEIEIWGHLVGRKKSYFLLFNFVDKRALCGIFLKKQEFIFIFLFFYDLSKMTTFVIVEKHIKPTHLRK